MIRWLRDIFLVLCGRGVVVHRDVPDLIEQAYSLATVLPTLEPQPHANGTKTITLINMAKNPKLARLQAALAYLATLPALFDKTRRALEEALANQMPADTRRELEALREEVATKTAELGEFEALADSVGAATDAADTADTGLPGADEGEGEPTPPTGDGTPPDSGTGSDPANTGTGDGSTPPASDPATPPADGTTPPAEPS